MNRHWSCMITYIFMSSWTLSWPLLRGLCNFVADYPFQRIHIHKRIVIFQIETLVPAADAVWGGFPCHNKASCWPQSGVDTAFPPGQSRVQLSLPFPAPARCPITQREINFICATILWLDSTASLVIFVHQRPKSRKCPHDIIYAHCRYWCCWCDNICRSAITCLGRVKC